MRLIHQINDMNHDVKLCHKSWGVTTISQPVAMWHATWASHDHKLLLFTKSCKKQ